MLPGRTYSLDQIVRLARARWWMLALPLVIGLAAGAAAYRLLPVTYRSETLIMVVPQRIPDTYVKSTVSANVEDRLRSVSEQILSRSRLQRIIQDFDLYAEARRSGPMEDVLVQMTNDIAVKLQPNETSFRVAYTNADPAVAEKVTERLAALFIEENVRDRENLADSTSKFIDSQLQEAKQQLIVQEKKLEEYRRRFAGQLPSQLQGNLQSVQNTQMQLQALSETTNRARERRLLLERQLGETQSLPAETMIAGGNGADGVAGLTKSQQLESAAGRLDVLKQRYTPDHPDVLALEQTVRDLQREVESDARQPRSLGAPVARTAAELARQKRLGDLQAELAVVDRQLTVAQADEARLRQTMASVSGNIASVPTRESELVELTRDYSTLQETYTSLLQKRSDSTLAANLERRQIGEQFRILDPASHPERPANQKQRLAALAGGPLLGLGLGLLVVGFLEFRDGSFRSEDDVLRVLSLPVLALVPVLDERRDGGRPGRKHLGGAVGGLVLMIGAVARFSASFLG